MKAAAGRKPDNTIPRIPAEDKRMRFIQEYPKDNNGAAAAVRAGYAPKTAHVTASRLLRDANIRAAIQKAQAELAAEAKLDAQAYWRHLRELLDFDPIDIFDENGKPKELKDIPLATRKCLRDYKLNRRIIDGQEIIEVDVKFPDPLAVVQELGKALRIAENGNNQITAIQVNVSYQ